MTVWAIFSCRPAAASQPLAWVVPNSLQRVGPTDPAGSGTTAVVHSARGEYEAFQVGIQASAGPVSNINFSVSDLLGRGGTVIPAANLILYREHYITISRNSQSWNGPPNLPLDHKTFPDALIPFIDPATGMPPAGGKFHAVPFDLNAGNNAVIWVDVFVPRTARAGLYTGAYTVNSDQGSVRGDIQLHVWNFSLPLLPSLKSSFTGCCDTAPVSGLFEELLRHKLMPDTVNPADERGFIEHLGLNATDLGFWGGVFFGFCQMSPAPSVEDLLEAKAAHQAGLLLYDDSADPESSCTDSAFYEAIISWARNLHQAGIRQLVTQEPVPELYDDGLGTGRSAVDIWTMLPLAYNEAQSFSPPRVSYVLQKGDSAWSYTALVQDSYSPKWEIDFLPINYRIQPGFISQSLGLTGILYWSVDFWSANPWTNIEKVNGYPGEGVLVYPGDQVGISGVVPSMRLKYLRDGVEDYEYIQLLKNCGQEAWALGVARNVAADWSHWTRDETLLESVREELGRRIAGSGCADK